MKTAVCAIARLENKYLREWVEHYKKIGFDNVILYDNNDINGERFEEVISDYIESGFAIVKNVRGEKDIQIKSYDECYKNNNNYDWIAFFDIDEFLILEPNVKICDFLNEPKFASFNCIKINWRNFDDNNLIKIENDNYSTQRFTNPIKIDSLVTKCIVKTNINSCLINSAHGPLSYVILTFYGHNFSQGNDQFVVSCDVNGNPCKNKKDIYIRGDHKVVLNHYRYKTIDEYIKFKTLRGYPEKWAKYGLSFLTIDNFFTYNKLSYKKYKYAKNLLKGHSQFKTRCYLYSIIKHYYFKIHNSRLLLHHKIFGD